MRNAVLFSVLACLCGGLAAQNNAPTLTLTRLAMPVTNNAVFKVPYNTTVASQSFSIEVDDLDSDPCDLFVTITSHSSQGIVISEWQAVGAAVPFTLTPMSGQFNVPDVIHNIRLTCSDGTDGAAVTFNMLVGPQSGDGKPQILFRAQGSIRETGHVFNVPFNTPLAAATISIRVYDYEDNPASLDMEVTNMTTQGLVASEWESATQATPFNLGPTTGVFNQGDAHHVLTLTATGSGGSTRQYFVVLVGDAMGGNAPPFIGVFSGNTYITDTSTLPVGYNATVASLGLSVLVADADGDNVDANLLSITNVTNQGFVNSQWSSAAALTPYRLDPTTGQFTVASTDHVVTLSASDGVDTSGFSFTLQVGAVPPPAPPGGTNDDRGDDGGGCAAASGLPLPAIVALAAIRRRRRN